MMMYGAMLVGMQALDSAQQTPAALRLEVPRATHTKYRHGQLAVAIARGPQSLNLIGQQLEIASRGLPPVRMQVDNVRTLPKALEDGYVALDLSLAPSLLPPRERANALMQRSPAITIPEEKLAGARYLVGPYAPGTILEITSHRQVITEPVTGSLSYEDSVGIKQGQRIASLKPKNNLAARPVSLLWS